MALERGLREHGIEIALPKLDVRMRPDEVDSRVNADRPRVFGS